MEKDTGSAEWLHSDGTIMLEKAFKTYFKALHAYACTIVKDDALAEDIVQQMFFKLWEKKERITVNQSLAAYLYRAVYHDSLNHLKHAKVKQAYQQHAVYHQSGHTSKTADKLLLGELEQQLYLAMNELPEQCRTIFQMSRFEMLKYQEIADRLGIAVKTVENQVGKALRILRGRLVDFLPLLILLFNR
ncbi:RNA polymerase sigma-70 factor [Chitinophaga agrisoli]|uniref:RNA polymerase sigma-70 factor n=1 Tax=Chitinophaga agrisoli TaxID=2607653 RepID=A0A5B2VK77_9BACT|nr:RNA polymerase sigma-70 factor [Chitinophaga agrisoli]KAA2238649.1 RNA polymerase sigma-70 factor [Chitinophaga agrisoli]